MRRSSRWCVASRRARALDAAPLLPDLGMSDGKRLLVVQYTFPPLGGAGVQRVLKFVKYLVALGWEIKVLTTASLDYTVHDHSLARRGARRGRGDPRPRVADPPCERRSAEPAASPQRSPDCLKFVGWPDERSGWLPFAAREGLRMADRFRPDVVFSSSSPTSAHVIARVVSKARGIPWVADFRDPWTQVEDPERSSPARGRQPAHRAQHRYPRPLRDGRR